MNIRPNVLVIIKSHDKLLCIKGFDQKTGETFYRLLGGGIEFGEHSKQALSREIKEELDKTIVDTHLLCVVENIFEFNEVKNHEITFLYEGRLLETDAYSEEYIKICDKKDSYAQWISIDEVKNKNNILYPKETLNFL